MTTLLIWTVFAVVAVGGLSALTRGIGGNIMQSKTLVLALGALIVGWFLILAQEQIRHVIEIATVPGLILFSVVIAGGLAFGGFYASVFWADRREDLLLKRATRKMAERDANRDIIIAPPGHQVVLSEIVQRSRNTLLHLLTSPFAGREATNEEKHRYAFFNLAHATVSKPDVILEEMPKLGPGYPQSVNLMDLLPDGASLHNIVLGLHVKEDGSREVIRETLLNLIHIAVGGASGWGKSVCLRSLAFQMTTCVEPTEVCFIDLEAATFTTFGNSERLRYPITDNGKGALAILSDLGAEIGKRKALFAKYPTVESLSGYNQQTDEPLPPICLFMDEVTTLLKRDKAVETVLTQQILRARKYGIRAILGGQSWKADIMDTTIRGQFSTTIHFHAHDKSSSQVLLGSGAAAEITQKGMAYAIIPGRPMIDLLSPKMSLQAVEHQLGDGPPKVVELPKLLSEPDESLMMDLPKPTENQGEILKLWDAGDFEEADITTVAGQISGQVYNDAGGRQRELVMKTLKKFSRIK